MPGNRAPALSTLIERARRFRGVTIFFGMVPDKETPKQPDQDNARAVSPPSRSERKKDTLQDRVDTEVAALRELTKKASETLKRDLDREKRQGTTVARFFKENRVGALIGLLFAVIIGWFAALSAVQPNWHGAQVGGLWMLLMAASAIAFLLIREVESKLWRGLYGGMAVLIIVTAIIVTHNASVAAPVTTIGSVGGPMATPIPIFITAYQPAMVKSKQRKSFYEPGANVYYSNDSANTYRIMNYTTSTLTKTVPEDSFAYIDMFAQMRAATDKHVQTTTMPAYAGTSGPWATNGFVSAYLTSGHNIPEFIGGPKLHDFLLGNSAFYFAGTIQAVRGDQVINVPYCGYVIHFLGQDVTFHNGPAVCSNT